MIEQVGLHSVGLDEISVNSLNVVDKTFYFYTLTQINIIGYGIIMLEDDHKYSTTECIV